MKRHVLTGLCWLSWAAVGCGDGAPASGWRFRFAEPALGARAQIVETELRRGGCGGEVVFVTRVSPTVPGAAAPKLVPGRYGFQGRARDADCLWFAEGCAEAELPHRGVIDVVLDQSLAPSADPSCVPGDSTGEPVTGLDAGATSVAEASPADASMAAAPDASDGASDAGPSPPDATTVSFDPSASKCTGLDPSVVACFDFEASLRDASGAGNDATSSATLSFEPALSGQGLRVGAERVAVADETSLNVQAFTIELWIRPDDLVNLDDEAFDVSLLLDKDQQYNVGFAADGALRMQVYRGIEDAESTTANSSFLVAGQPSYVAFSYDGTVSVIYKDGVRVESENLALSLFAGNGGAMHIGSGSPSTTRPFDGLIDALRISNVARSDGAICASAGKRLGPGGCQ